MAEHRLGTPDLTDTELSASDYARVVWRQRGLILVLGIVVVLTTLVTTLVSSRIYESAASVILSGAGGPPAAVAGTARSPQVAASAVDATTLPSRAMVSPSSFPIYRCPR